jgi:hypothetical protein
VAVNVVTRRVRTPVVDEARARELDRLIFEAVDDGDPRDVFAHVRIPKAKRVIEDIDRLVKSLNNLTAADENYETRWSDVNTMLMQLGTLKRRLTAMSVRNG